MLLPTMFMIIGPVMSSVEAAIGGPLLGVGVRHMLAYKSALRAGLRDPLLREEARRQIATDMRRERIGMIASGVVFALTAAGAIAAGVEMGLHSDNGEAYFELLAVSAVSGVAAAGSLFTLAFCGANYQSYKSLLAGEDASPALSSLSVTPVVSSSMYELSLSGKW